MTFVETKEFRIPLDRTFTSAHNNYCNLHVFLVAVSHALSQFLWLHCIFSHHCHIAYMTISLCTRMSVSLADI